jgi:hypothetical protein
MKARGQMLVTAVRRRNKYGAVKTAVNGIIFDSKREAGHYVELLTRMRAGEISDLKIQVPFPITINGKKICKYIADFTFIENGKLKVADSKGMKTGVYKLKKKMVEAFYGIEILEM